MSIASCEELFWGLVMVVRKDWCFWGGVDKGVSLRCEGEGKLAHCTLLCGFANTRFGGQVYILPLKVVETFFHHSCAGKTLSL